MSHDRPIAERMNVAFGKWTAAYKALTVRLVAFATGGRHLVVTHPGWAIALSLAAAVATFLLGRWVG